MALALCVMGCAGIGSQYAARPIDGQGRVTSARATDSGLAISADELTDYASDYFGLVEITFKNGTARWVHVNRLSLDFGDSARDAAVRVPNGSDLDSWYLSTVQRNDIRDTNRAAVLGALFAVGEAVSIAGAVSGKREVRAAGNGMALGAATVALVDGQDRRVQRAESVRLLPESHLLEGPFSVPPGLFTKKWVLLQKRSLTSPCISSLRIDYDVEERGRERVLVKFRDDFDRSQWQRRVCGPRPGTLSGPPRY